ncbi:MAG: hypothetical protein IJ212_00395 [Bacteroidaceae bacterium]|nr:hypothetical protein [Bacteroidaceae bacterium]
MKKILSLLLLALGMCLPASAQNLEIKEQDPAKHQPRVFPLPVKHLYFHSEILGVDKNFSVILPRNYDKEPDRTYPILYLLHGGGENDWEWANIPVSMLCEAVAKVTGDGTAAEMIIVQPNATEYKGGYNNRDDWKYEDYFLKELMPTVEKYFRVKADKGHRCIGGLSMGAGGTYLYALGHPDLFCAAYAISGHSSLDVTTLSPEELEKQKTVAWTIDCGGNDIAFDNAVKTFQQMRNSGMNVQFRAEYGVHATFYWYDGLCKALRFFTRNFADRCK